MPDEQIAPGARVVYAGGLYEVEAVNGDLLVLVGVTDIETRTCRETATVLVEDVTVLGHQDGLGLEDR